MAILDQLEAEWPVIAGAPWSHWLFLIGVLVTAVLAAHAWNRREMRGLERERDAADKEKKLADSQRDVYKTEAENAQKQIQELQENQSKTPKVPENLAPVMYGSASVQDAFVSVTTAPAQTIVITDIDYAKIAAYMRLQEAGLAEVRHPESGQYTATGTNTAAGLRHLYDAAQRKKK